MINVRFAPSPTGSLHIGGARTALFNYLFAKKNNGKFILRIDDTDTSRNSKDSLDLLIKDLKWLGIQWDIGPLVSDPKDYQSSHRNDLYLQYANQLVNDNKAIKNDDGSIDALLNPNTDITLKDLIKGNVTFPKDNIQSKLTIIRSNQIATYNFATVIDDHLMNISHIFRADEHLQNTPKQILIYNLFNWAIPQFGHMGLICDQSGKKLSKRDGAASLSDFKDLGIIPQAMFHYLSFLGWGRNKLDNQIVNQDQLAQCLDLNLVKKGSSRFDINKLYQLNQIYLKNQNLDYLNFSDLFMKTFLPRSKTINDLINYKKMIDLDPDYKLDLLKSKLTNYSKDLIIQSVDDLINQKVLDDKILSSSLLRFGMIGLVDGVNNDDLISLIGLNKVIDRLKSLKVTIIDFY